MALEGILDVVKLGSHSLQRVVIQFFAVVAHPRRFIRTVHLDRTDTIVNASVFAIFISITGLIVTLSALLLAHIKADAPSFILIDTVLTFAVWFLKGSMFHLCFILFKGKGTYQSSIVAYLYLTAFNLIGTLLALPLLVTIIPSTLQSAETAVAQDMERLRN